MNSISVVNINAGSRPKLLSHLIPGMTHKGKFFKAFIILKHNLGCRILLVTSNQKEKISLVIAAKLQCKCIGPYSS